MSAVMIVLLAVMTPAQGVEVGLKGTVPVGQKPAISVTARQAVANAVVLLKRSDGKDVKLQTGKLKAGAHKDLLLDQPAGSFHYEGTLTATYPGSDEQQSMPLAFDAHVLAPPSLSLDPADVHLEDQRVLVTLNRPCARVTFTVYGDAGGVIDQGDSQFKGAPAGEKLPVVWKVGEEKVIRLDMVGHDVHGMFSPTLSIFPWSLEIPHQDVNFATGQSVIPPDEMPKVKTAVDDIQTAIKRYGGIVKITLFVAGHTDTVGSAEGNHLLSEARAASIGRAFRKAGIKVPIRYVGFGEDNLKVSTPDETDELQNRRAAYIISVEPPPVSGTDGWKPLP